MQTMNLILYLYNILYSRYSMCRPQSIYYMLAIQYSISTVYTDHIYIYIDYIFYADHGLNIIFIPYTIQQIQYVQTIDYISYADHILQYIHSLYRPYMYIYRLYILCRPYAIVYPQSLKYILKHMNQSNNYMRGIRNILQCTYYVEKFWKGYPFNFLWMK